jgi:glutamyl-tRNA synthetase
VLRVGAGFRTFADVVAKAGFLFIPDDAISFDQAAVAKHLLKNEKAGLAMLERIEHKLGTVANWNASELEQAIQTICAETGTGMGNVAQPLRVALTGGTISPTIGETLALLGRERTMHRIRRCLKNFKDSDS